MNSYFVQSCCRALLLALTAIRQGRRTRFPSLPMPLLEDDFHFSEPGGSFQLKSSSNDLLPVRHASVDEYRQAGRRLSRRGAEQNFTYIAALQPKIAFIFDIRRDMMLRHLMYKAIFEMSEDRAGFVGSLFSRKRPAGLTADSPVQAIFQAFAAAPRDPERGGTVEGHHAPLTMGHRFQLSQADRERIRFIT